MQRAFNIGGTAGLRVLDPVLLSRISDARTLRAAADHLRQCGGKTPGPNHRRLEEMDSPEIWSMCRALGHGIRNGAYKPGGSRMVSIPKPGKPGEFRTLAIQNAEDRVVARAVVLVLQPIVEYYSSPFSFGFRPRRNRFHALATALSLAEAENRWHWLKADIEKAFDRIPFERLMQIWSQNWPADVVSLVRAVSCLGRDRGTAFSGSLPASTGPSMGKSSTRSKTPPLPATPATS